jgi:NADPH-dependent curcumin reductase CurA
MTVPLIVPVPKEIDAKGVTYHHILVYSTLKPKNESDFTKMAEWYRILPSYVESGKLSKGVVPLKVYDGGLDDIPEAIDYVRQGKTSGQKVVVTLKK